MWCWFIVLFMIINIMWGCLPMWHCLCLLWPPTIQQKDPWKPTHKYVTYVRCLDEFGVKFSYVGVHLDKFGQNFGPMYVPWSGHSQGVWQRYVPHLDIMGHHRDITLSTLETCHVKIMILYWTIIIWPQTMCLPNIKQVFLPLWVDIV